MCAREAFQEAFSARTQTLQAERGRFSAILLPFPVRARDIWCVQPTVKTNIGVNTVIKTPTLKTSLFSAVDVEIIFTWSRETFLKRKKKN